MTAPQDGQTRTIQVPPEQFRSTPITMYHLAGRSSVTEDALDATTKVGIGSAFFYHLDGQLFLVTARHCFSARSWETGQFMPGSGSVEPTHVELSIRKRPADGKWNMREPALATRLLLPLLDEDGQPRWFEHPQAGAGVDVAALPLPASVADDELLMIEAYSPPPTDDQAARLDAAVAKDVFVIGYPFGLQSGFMMPLWVRGTIASEPAMYYTHTNCVTRCEQVLPVVIIDARTREGQSGSPTILYQPPLTPIYTNSGQLGLTTGGVSRLLGVYSGRTGTDSDLGFVWRIETIDVLCRAATRARLDYKWPLPEFPPV